MKRLWLILSFLSLGLSGLLAEVVTLRSGKVVRGEILVHNDEVLIVRDAAGARFQFPAADVLTIEQEHAAAVTKEESVEQESQRSGERRTTIRLEIGGGGLFGAAHRSGGAMSVEMLVGARNVLNKRIFLGGSVGYMGGFTAENKYSFLPLQIAMRAPLMEGKHAPMVGLSLGYGVAMSKDYLGGLHTGVMVGYLCQLSERSSLTLAADLKFQQARLRTLEQVEESLYTHKAGCSMVSVGLKMGVSF